MDGLVTLESYGSVLDARLAASRLEGAGIRAFLRDEQIVDADPLLVGAVGGVRIQVFADDEQAAREVLAHGVDGAEDEGDDGDPVPRCPTCDSEYVVAAGGNPTGAASAELRCRRCKFSGPASDFTARSLSLPNGVRPPVYRLLRGAGFAGAVLGFVGGFVVGGMLGRAFSPGIFAGAVFLGTVLIGPFIGSAVGRRMTRAVCSEPSCRAPLSLAESVCPRCRRHIEGAIRGANEHYVRIAEWRRAMLAGAAGPNAERDRGRD
jgi:hypothetical protein